MSTEDVMKELTEMRKEIKSLTKLVRKIAKVQDDPDGSKAKERAANTGFNKPSKVTKDLTPGGYCGDQALVRDAMSYKILGGIGGSLLEK